MKKLLLLLPIIALTSCAVTLDERGKPQVGTDQRSLQTIIEKINRELLKATK